MLQELMTSLFGIENSWEREGFGQRDSDIKLVCNSGLLIAGCISSCVYMIHLQ